MGKKTTRSERYRQQHPGRRWMAEMNEEGRCLIADLVNDGNRIEAIKTIRLATKCGLAEAMEATKYAEKYGVEV